MKKNYRLGVNLTLRSLAANEVPPAQAERVAALNDQRFNRQRFEIGGVGFIRIVCRQRTLRRRQAMRAGGI
jgi:hypothetical protein